MDKFYKKKQGEQYIFALALGLVISLIMVIWIVVIILSRGLGFFWPGEIVHITTKDDRQYLGELWTEETRKEHTDSGIVKINNTQLKTGNRDVYGIDFVWINNATIKSSDKPEFAVVFERKEYGNAYGYISSVQIGDSNYTYSEEKIISIAKKAFDSAQKNHENLLDIQEQINDLLAPLTRIQREISLLEFKQNMLTPAEKKELEILKSKAVTLEQSISAPYQKLTDKLAEYTEIDRKINFTLSLADDRAVDLKASKIVRFYLPNQMNVFSKSVHYISKLWELVSAEPRESNTEGGIFPAIFGTVLMVILMSIAVVPLGVMVAIYLNEYAHQGVIIRAIRMAISNLAGVPSIVFGIFGLGFFIYYFGGSIDQMFFSDKLPEPTFGTGGILWASLTLALLTLPVVVVATEEGLLAVPRANKEGALALGATQWQMIRKIVLPNAMPGILTGIILAVSRGAGEVAPLMITGVVKLAPAMPFDLTFPFFHLDRKFMHLGFHIYDVGFQSPNVEAAKPMVYLTALLLIAIVVALNLLAIFLRNQLRKKLKTSAF
ncbi:MAG: phosphate ABC transporter permease PstA [Calditrichaeota bacterium]|nr:MAG: phosphate ABC transporter permease PstA [Calditrichota bacterium]